MKFNLGDRVKSLGNFSPIITGIIVAVNNGDFYHEICPWCDIAWKVKFPNWQSQLVYTVKLDFKEKTVFQNVEQANNISAPFAKYINFAEDDLMQFDWIKELEKIIKE